MTSAGEVIGRGFAFTNGLLIARSAMRSNWSSRTQTSASRRGCPRSAISRATAVAASVALASTASWTSLSRPPTWPAFQAITAGSMTQDVWPWATPATAPS